MAKAKLNGFISWIDQFGRSSDEVVGIERLVRPARNRGGAYPLKAFRLGDQAPDLAEKSLPCW